MIIGTKQSDDVNCRHQKWLIGEYKITNYARLRGRQYIHTCRPTPTSRAIFHEQRICSVTFTVV